MNRLLKGGRITVPGQRSIGDHGQTSKKPADVDVFELPEEVASWCCSVFADFYNQHTI